MENHVKIHFEFGDQGSDNIEVESLWAVPHGDGYRLDNIPFHVKGFAVDDVVGVKSIDGHLYADKLLKASGHSTVRIWLSNENEVQQVRDTLSSLGCSSELSDQRRLVAVDIPTDVPYVEVKAYLDTGVANGRWDYQEACLGFE